MSSINGNESHMLTDRLTLPSISSALPPGHFDTSKNEEDSTLINRHADTSNNLETPQQPTLLFSSISRRNTQQQGTVNNTTPQEMYTPCTPIPNPMFTRRNRLTTSNNYKGMPSSRYTPVRQNGSTGSSSASSSRIEDEANSTPVLPSISQLAKSPVSPSHHLSPPSSSRTRRTILLDSPPSTVPSLAHTQADEFLNVSEEEDIFGSSNESGSRKSREKRVKRTRAECLSDEDDDLASDYYSYSNEYNPSSSAAGGDEILSETYDDLRVEPASKKCKLWGEPLTNTTSRFVRPHRRQILPTVESSTHNSASEMIGLTMPDASINAGSPCTPQNSSSPIVPPLNIPSTRSPETLARNFGSFVPTNVLRSQQSINFNNTSTTVNRPPSPPATRQTLTSTRNNSPRPLNNTTSTQRTALNAFESPFNFSTRRPNITATNSSSSSHVVAPRHLSFTEPARSRTRTESAGPTWRRGNGPNPVSMYSGSNMSTSQILDDLERLENRISDEEYARRLQAEESIRMSRFAMLQASLSRFGQPIYAYNEDESDSDSDSDEGGSPAAVLAQHLLAGGTRGSYVSFIQSLFNRTTTHNNPLLALSLVDRDFTEDDYEMLLRLDETVENHKVAPLKSINNLEAFKLKQGEERGRCCVCLCDMTSGDCVKRLPCNHHFHADCIDVWLKDYNGICPMCKKNISENDNNNNNNNNNTTKNSEDGSDK